MGAYKKGTEGYIKQQAKRRETMLRKYGGEDGVHGYYQNIGHLGGSAVTDGKKKGGFGKSKEWARACGKKGGKISRRGPAKGEATV